MALCRPVFAVCVSGQPRTLNMILPPQLKVMNVDPRAFGKSFAVEEARLAEQNNGGQHSKSAVQQVAGIRCLHVRVDQGKNITENRK